MNILRNCRRCKIYKDFGPIQIKIDRAYSSDLDFNKWEFNALNPLFLELADKYLRNELTEEQFIETLTRKIVEDPGIFRDAPIDSEIPEDDYNDYKAYGPIAIRIEEGVNPLYWEFDEMNPVFLEMAVKAYRREIPEDKFLEEIQDIIAEDPEAFRKKSEWEMEIGTPEYYGKPYSEKDKCEFRKRLEEERAKPSVLTSKIFQELDEKRLNGQITKDEMRSIILKKIDEGYDFANG